jgi:hypothetical protein
MLPREIVEELIGKLRATRLHILVALADSFDRFLVVLTFPFEVVGQDIVKSVGRCLATSLGELLELR